MDTTCHEHSGCLKDIENLKKETDDQWKSISHMKEKIDGIMTRLNVILCGIIVAIIGLLGNIAFEGFGK